MEKVFAYVCDRRRSGACGKCDKNCKHTTEKEYAKYKIRDKDRVFRLVDANPHRMVYEEIEYPQCMLDKLSVYSDILFMNKSQIESKEKKDEQ